MIISFVRIPFSLDDVLILFKRKLIWSTLGTKQIKQGCEQPYGN